MPTARQKNLKLNICGGESHKVGESGQRLSFNQPWGGGLLRVAASYNYIIIPLCGKKF